MSEFVDRMSAQRAVLQAVNSRPRKEELFGLSSQAIDRWMDRNGVSPDSDVVVLLRSTSEQLSFLASKSQMHLLSDYRQVSAAVDALTDRIRKVMT